MEEMATYGHALSRFQQMCQKYPEKLAIVYVGEKFSFSELKELSDRFAIGLSDLGVRQNDRVLIYLPNCIQWVIAYLAILKIGAVAVPVSPIYTPGEITYMINDSDAETIICQDANFGYVKEVLPNTGLKRIIVTNLADLHPCWKRIVGRLFDKTPRGSVEWDKNVYPFKALLRKSPFQPPSPGINPTDDLAYIYYTGGTSGLPKGVPGSHAGLGQVFDDFHAVVGNHITEDQSVIILTLPLFHVLGMAFFLCLGLGLANTTVLMPVPQVDAILEGIQRYKVNVFLGVPTLYRMILENDRLDLFDLSSLKYSWSGGDVLPAEVFNRWKELLKIPIYQIYGSTETMGVAIHPLDQTPTATKLGPPVPSKEVKIVDPDTLEPVPINTPGEALVSGRYVRSYWNKPEETVLSFVRLDGKLYYRTKDIVRKDEEGNLFYVDRSADVIKYKGFRVSASEVEAVLQCHPSVIGACAVGVPDARVGERIKAMVVLKEGTRGVSATDLIKWCREHLAPYKIPDYIEFRDMLPKSKVGKLLRREIREDERRRLFKEKE